MANSNNATKQQRSFKDLCRSNVVDFVVAQEEVDAQSAAIVCMRAWRRWKPAERRRHNTIVSYRRRPTVGTSERTAELNRLRTSARRLFRRLQRYYSDIM